MKFTQFFLLLFPLLILSPSAQAQGTQYRGVTVGSDISPDDISVLASWRVNLVRYPLAWGDRASFADEASYYDWLQSALDRFDELLPYFQENGINVVLELYSPPGGFVYNGRPQHRVFSERWAQEALLVVWNEIASRYAQEQTIWGYDVLNEPAEGKVTPGLMKWKDLALQLAQTIRAVDPQHRIIVESAYGNPLLLSKIKRLPLSGIVYSVHVYYPGSFVQQGLYGNPFGVYYPSKKANKKGLAKILKPVVAYARRNGVPIYVGEFSVVRWAPGNSAYMYMSDVISLLEQYGWDWTYHSFRESDPWSVEHGSDPNDHSPSPVATDRMVLLQQFFGLNR